MAKVTIPGGFFDEDNHRYTSGSGVIIPSVTQVFALLGWTDYGSIRKEVLERKSALGVAVHAGLQFLCEKSLDWDSVDEQALPYIVAAECWMREMGFISLAQETQGINTVNGMSYGFMFDNRGTVMYKGRHRHLILDYKTTVAISPTCAQQTAGYSLAAPKLPAGERYLRCILQLRADGTFRPFYYEDRQDELSFQYALYTAIWALNHGLYTLEAA